MIDLEAYEMMAEEFASSAALSSLPGVSRHGYAAVAPIVRTPQGGPAGVRCLLVLCLLFGLWLPSNLGSQEPVLCTGCELSIEPEIRLSSDVADIVPSMAVSVARLRDGRYVVSPLFQPPQLVVYGSDGRFISLHSNQGQGPGEFTAAPSLLVDGDGNLVAVETRDRRRVVRLTPQIEHIDTRMTEFQIGAHALALSGGRIVSATQLASPGHQASLLAVVNADGDLVATLDPSDASPAIHPAVVGPALDGGFWTGRRNSSELVQRAADGEEVHRITVERDWFAPWAERVEGAPWAAPPNPSTTSVLPLDESHLLLHTRVAAGRYEPLFEPGEPMVLIPTEMDRSTLFDSVFEVVDQASGEVVARQLLDVDVVPVSGTHDQFASTSQDQLGHVEVTIWRVRFRKQER